MPNFVWPGRETGSQFGVELKITDTTHKVFYCTYFFRVAFVIHIGDFCLHLNLFLSIIICIILSLYSVRWPEVKNSPNASLYKIMHAVKVCLLSTVQL